MTDSREFTRLGMNNINASKNRFHPEQRPCDSWLSDGTKLKGLVVKLCSIVGRKVPTFKNIFETLDFFNEVKGYVPNIKYVSERRVVDKKRKTYIKKNGHDFPIFLKHKRHRHTFRYEFKNYGKNIDARWRELNIKEGSPFRSSKNFRIFIEVYGIMKGRLENCRTQSVTSHSAVIRRLGILNHQLSETDASSIDHNTKMFLDYIITCRSKKDFNYGLDEYAIILLDNLFKSKSTDWFLVACVTLNYKIFKKLNIEEIFKLDDKITHFLKHIITCLNEQWKKGVNIQSKMGYTYKKNPLTPTNSFPVRYITKRVKNPDVPKDIEKGINYWAFNHLAFAYNNLTRSLSIIRMVTSNVTYFDYKKKMTFTNKISIPLFRNIKKSYFGNDDEYLLVRKFHSFYSRENQFYGPWITSSVSDNNVLNVMIDNFIQKCRDNVAYFNEKNFRNNLLL